jgi:hypothetical protein
MNIGSTTPISKVADRKKNMVILNGCCSGTADWPSVAERTIMVNPTFRAPGAELSANGKNFPHFWKGE